MGVAAMAQVGYAVHTYGMCDVLTPSSEYQVGWGCGNMYMLSAWQARASGSGAAVFWLIELKWVKYVQLELGLARTVPQGVFAET